MYKTEARLKIKKAFSASIRCEEKTTEISSIIGLENYLKKFNSIASYSSIAYEFPSGEVNKWILNKKRNYYLLLLLGVSGSLVVHITMIESNVVVAY